LTKTNDQEIELTFNEYGCKENILGSDHRPVFLDFRVDLKLNHLMDPHCLTSKSDQGFGKLRLKSFKLTF